MKTQRVLAALALAVATLSFAAPAANAAPDDGESFGARFRLPVVVDVVHAEAALDLGIVDLD
ncbi:hypothetical protein [Streptomyces lateritius]|uniref:hypothetical protein n=1 Tax=Streptomyces lateritius TaxID=67313 RepID=UPI00167820F2|nr:hypothetical protein [Streptomyces lateritius]